MRLSKLDVYCILRKSGLFVPVGYFKKNEISGFYIWNNIAIKPYNCGEGQIIEISGKIPIELREEFSYLTISISSDKDIWLVEGANILKSNIDDEFFKEKEENDKYICYLQIDSREDLLKFIYKLDLCYKGLSHFFKSVDNEIDSMVQKLREDKIKVICYNFFDNKQYDELCRRVKDNFDNAEKMANKQGDVERGKIIQELRSVLNELVETMMLPIYREDNQDIEWVVANSNIEAEIYPTARMIEMSTAKSEKWWCLVDDGVFCLGLEGENNLRCIVEFRKILEIKFGSRREETHFRPNLLKLHSNENLSDFINRLRNACLVARRVIPDNIDSKFIGGERTKKRTSNDNK